MNGAAGSVADCICLVFRSRILHAVGMRKRFRIWFVILLVALVGVGAWFVLRPQGGRLIKGKTERDWIKSLNYSGDSAEAEQWRALGPEGIRMLIKALEAGNGPMESRYTWLWPKLPPFLRQRVPIPANSYKTRMCAVSMLRRLGTDARSAVPAMIRTLRVEKLDGVRQGVIGCFDEDMLKGLGREKGELLPELVRAMQSSDWGLRNNAAISLGCYPERADVVAPVLVKAAHDSNVQVQLMAVGALYRVAPRLAGEPEMVQIVINVLKDPDDQIAYRAATLLGEMGVQPSLAVPALIEALQGTNTLVACTSAYALGKFKGQADTVVPVLVRGLNHSDGSVRSAAGRALKQIDPEAAVKAGVK
ncbi:MAG: hypothetical protein JWR69_939 [Pedosphaera sp.]|nr:hypothetical protein [Pedosphaera sp.]